MKPAGHKRPGTAVIEKGRKRIEEILDAATEILIEDGYAQLSTRKIAAQAGIRPGNLQYYYRTKADVVRALLERYLARSMQAIEERVGSTSGTPEARLRAGLMGILADQQADGACQFFWEVWALAARDLTVARATQRFYLRYQEGVAEALLAVSPRLGRSRARRRAVLIVAMIEGLTIFRLGDDGNAADRPALVRELRSLVLHLAKEIDE
jgi:AcrR family transcriptional regulator